MSRPELTTLIERGQRQAAARGHSLGDWKRPRRGVPTAGAVCRKCGRVAWADPTLHGLPTLWGGAVSQTCARADLLTLEEIARELGLTPAWIARRVRGALGLVGRRRRRWPYPQRTTPELIERSLVRQLWGDRRRAP